MSYQKMSSKREEYQPTCAASLQNRHEILSNQIKRKNNMIEIKRTLNEIQDIEMVNYLISLVNEIYMDAQYKERTNLQMKEIIVKMERQMDNLRKIQAQNKNSYLQLPNYTFQEQLKRSERIIRDLQNKNLKLIDEIALYQREGYQMRIELSNSSLDNETEMLIQQLTLQLQQQKSRANSLASQMEYLQSQLKGCERELTDKAKKIRILQLQINKKYS